MISAERPILTERGSDQYAPAREAKHAGTPMAVVPLTQHEAGVPMSDLVLSILGRRANCLLLRG